MARSVIAASFASTPSVRRRMQAQSRRNTGCELLVRRAVHAQGLRYRVHCRAFPELRRDADLVFSGARVAVFVDGCFWHGCARHKAPVRANATWWEAKLRRTVERDRETNARLVDAGWSVVRVWEHADPVQAAAVIAKLVRRIGSVPSVVIVD